MFRDQEITPRPFPAWAWATILLPRAFLAYLCGATPDIGLTSDSMGYLALGRNLMNHSVFSSSTSAPWMAETVRVPGYPLFLAPFLYFTDSPIRVIEWAQLFLSLCTVLIFYGWLSTLCRSRIAVLFSVLLGLDLVTLFHIPQILPETLFCLVLVIILSFLWKAVRFGSYSSLIIAGVALSMATLIKPIAFYWALPISLLWLARHDPKRWAIWLLAAYLLPGLWIVRNGHQTGSYAFTAQGGMDLLKYPAASVESLRTGQPWETVYPELQEQADGSIDPSDPVAQSHAQGHLAIQILRAHPFYLLEHCGLGLVKILGGNCFIIPMQWFGMQSKQDVLFGSVPRWHQNLDLLFRHVWITIAGIIYTLYLLFLYVLFLAGLWSLWKHRRGDEAYLLLLGPLYFVGLASIEGYCRYRIPAVPFFVAGAALAIQIKWKHLSV